jgi:hypothetical protein
MNMVETFCLVTEQQRPYRQNNVLLPLVLFTCMEHGFHKRGDNHLRSILGVNDVYYRSHLYSTDRIGGVMVSVLASCAVDGGF